MKSHFGAFPDWDLLAFFEESYVESVSVRSRGGRSGIEKSAVGARIVPATARAIMVLLQPITGHGPSDT